VVLLYEVKFCLLLIRKWRQFSHRSLTQTVGEKLLPPVPALMLMLSIRLMYLNFTARPCDDKGDIITGTT